MDRKGRNAKAAPPFLSTKASGHPLPVACCARGRSVRRSDRAPEGGRAGRGGTSHTDLTEGETRERRRTVRPRLTGQLRTCGITEGGSGALLRRGRWLVHDGQRSSWVPASTKAKTPQGGKRLNSRLTHSPFQALQPFLTNRIVQKYAESFERITHVFPPIALQAFRHRNS